MPWELVEGLIIKEFGWTLTELRQQPADDVLRMWAMLNKFNEFVAKRKV